jgi:hypothetical protein
MFCALTSCVLPAGPKSAKSNKNIGWCLPFVLQLGSHSGHIVNTKGMFKNQTLIALAKSDGDMVSVCDQVSRLHVQVEF